jgi:hypothetical protein
MILFPPSRDKLCDNYLLCSFHVRLPNFKENKTLGNNLVFDAISNAPVI